MKKDDNFKEQFKQALISTIKVISDDYKSKKDFEENLSSKNYNFFEIDNLNNKQEYIKLRAETDSEALKRKFSDKNIYQKNIPKNFSCKTLYDISEKIRYEMLGSKMLKGISTNLNKNYNYLLSIKRKDQLKSREDVSISEADWSAVAPASIAFNFVWSASVMTLESVAASTAALISALV